MAAECALNPSYRVPALTPSADGPYLTSGHGADRLNAAIPLLVKTSLAAAKAAEVALGMDPPRDERGGVRVPMVTGKSFRIGAVIARGGIIGQYELLKAFLKPRGYPLSRKDRENYTQFLQEEEGRLVALVNRRNDMTHEPDPSNDPDLRELVDYVWECHDLAQLVNGRHPWLASQ
jgi:succinate dehydrogenase flavin-adding protein (antitoxin of CptAB toxin-antitoxin module)